jgi:two-component system, NtrC family, sensor kinase
MERIHRRLNFLRGFAVRIFGLSWLVSILTLSIFVIAIIPEQKLDLQDALRSKALGISSLLQKVTAGAALSEDYRSVVDHCAQVLAGDRAIDYIVVTRNDGLSAIVERKSWRVETLGGFWRPAERQAAGGIQVVPDLGRRVFHFSKPFDYSAIQWGWIHVGVSLSAYDHSVSRIYQRTWWIAVLCLALSLLLSVVYARLQVRPIRSLQAAAGQIEKGDLSARAVLDGGEEIESLAWSFNTMAESLSQRNQILESVSFAAQQFLNASDPSEVIAEVLGKVGNAAQSSRAFVVENLSGGARGARSGLKYDWLAAGTHAGTGGSDAPDPIKNAGLPEGWAGKLSCGEVVCGCNHESESWGEPAGAHPAQSIILIPIYAGNEWFGFLGFCDYGHEREWSEAERDSFRAVAGMLGAAITRERAQHALLESKETLERRVKERTRELQDQVDAKERALAELAEAQQRLIELSRLSGMAETATGVLHNVGKV